MDIVINKKTGINQKLKWALLGIALLSVTLTYAWASLSTSSHSVNSDRLLTDNVSRGNFLITVRGMGVLAPKDVRWLATNVAGKVERILVKPGALVKKGDVIMVLSNPELAQRLEETRWELDELKAQMQAEKVSLESELLDQESAVLNEKLNFESTKLTFEAQHKLLSQGFNAVSQIDHENIKIQMAQNKRRWELEQARLVKQKERVAAQLMANEARVKRIEKTLNRVNEQVKNLTVIASIDALVQEMPIELGQQVNAGSNLARLAKRDEFIAEIRIPENQIQNIVIGQSVVIDTRTSEIEGVVRRIDPSVENGVVQVDIDLIGQAPKEARPELTVEGVIEIARMTEALFVKRPMFAKSHEKGFVYVLEVEGNTATKQQVEFGKSSTSHIEIISGLNEGQQIIVSDVSSYEQHQQININ
ncbi:efflux RND transporter periplasmic adaptor subunit [Alteromonas australica]|uniref:efflux RND transporter periplasmic adaptor subunit n=1 Tax=Alteromonas australica TaxID=589873 RepID=UPI0035C7EA93